MSLKNHPKLGVLLFWLTWPAIWLYLRTSHRTRLLIVYQDEFLVVRSWLGPGAYGLPGGGLHGQESPREGVLREVKEETGLVLDEKKLKHIYKNVSHSQGFRFPYDCFLLELSYKPDIQLQPEEIIDAQWQPLDNPSLPLEGDVFQALTWWHDQR